MVNDPAYSETIAAVATAPGRGAVGILRLSGPAAFSIAESLAGSLPAPRLATLRTFRGKDGAAIDQGLLLVFPAPNSYTGENVVELQGHGGPVLLDLLLRCACAHGARIARPGEFSERAFLNGRLDLVQAEAIADLINASTRQAAQAAHRSLEGELSRHVAALLEELTQLRVYVEGALDFSDEDVDWLADERLRGGLARLCQHLQDLLAQADQGRRLREGLVVALAGQPNVGKSTLLNCLSGNDSAIVTEIPGTTRDLLREVIDVDGLPVTVVDTAGLRDSEDPVERIGIERAWDAARRADLLLFMVEDQRGITAADRGLLKKLAGADRPTVVVRNKCDLSGGAPGRSDGPAGVELRLSAHTGAGLEILKSELRAAAGLESGGEGLFSARARHVDALRRALAFVVDASGRVREGATPELAAEELRLAQQALGEITGAFTPDNLLEKIFRQFCIGK